MTEMFGEAWSPMSVPDLAPDDDDDPHLVHSPFGSVNNTIASLPNTSVPIFTPNELILFYVDSTTKLKSSKTQIVNPYSLRG